MSGCNIMGIDPGLGGGIAILSDDGLLLEPMPRHYDGELDLVELNKIISDHAKDLRCAYLEKVHSMPKQGVVSTFTFGKVYGITLGMLVANKIEVVHVRPQEWMAEIHEDVLRRHSPKERSRRVFKGLFPHIDARRTPKCKGPDEGLVDAALIAEYGRRVGL